ncbi:MAG: hypothetical protein RSD28_07675 [Lachnospiraceae bacterium]
MVLENEKEAVTLEQISLFDNFKYCSSCKRVLPKKYEKDICPACEENALFNEVKEYIRSREVTEYQVAEHFNISHRQVKKWITEGRIEYKEAVKPVLTSLHCVKCGIPISFGNLCQKCYKTKYNTKAGYAPLQEKRENERMRYLEDNKE